MYNRDDITDFSQTFPGLSRNFSNSISNPSKNSEKCAINQLLSDISSENGTKIYQDDNQTQSMKRSATLPLNHTQKSFGEPKIVLPTDIKPAITEESVKEEKFDDKYDVLKNLKLNRLLLNQDVRESKVIHQLNQMNHLIIIQESLKEWKAGKTL